MASKYEVLTVQGAREAEVAEMTREQAIAWLCWNDPNGTYTDEDCVAEGQEPLTVDAARALILEQCAAGDA